jgi:hypothetical protein
MSGDPEEDIDPGDPDDGPRSRSPQQQREFEAALGLRNWVKELLDGPARKEWRMSPGELDNVFVGTFAKATKTYRAVLLLCDRGYGQQAGMLNRSLFEHAVVAWWLLLCPAEDEEETMAALRDHRAHARVLYDRSMEQHPELSDGGAASEDDPEETRERLSPFEPEYVVALDKRFGKYGGQWHGKRLDGLVREVEAVVDERYATAFWKFFRFVNHHNNYVLHHSAIGVADSVKWEDPAQAPSISVGPSQDWRDASLWAGFWSYGLLVLATLRRLSPERADEFSDQLDDWNRSFLAYRRDQVKDVGRNDLCPCASGKKFKHCHEPWVVD